MVLVGKSKFDKNGRVSLIKEIAELLDLMEGDYINYYVEGREVVIRKVTKIYPGGFDLEGELIADRLEAYEHTHGDYEPDEIFDEELARKMAEEQFAKDMAAREALKREMNQG